MPKLSHTSAVERNSSGRLVAERYRLLAPLASGGASTVFAALDLLTGREVALKQMRLDEVALARARLEIAILRRLQRPSLLPGVARLLDDGADDRHVWLVMERIDGAPFPGCATPCAWSAIAGTTLALLDTLSELHGAGVTHRDVKPENVLVDRAGQPVLVDFGIASLGEDFEEGITATREIRGTRESS